MINLQSEFIEFNDEIKLSYDDNAELREKRDILLRQLQNGISKEIPTFEHFLQGSYAMHTGIKPDDGDYDIDVGLRFHLSRADYPDPLIVKQWVFDALEGHTNKVEIRRSCVTVTYQENGVDVFHVDFACYADEEGSLFIAKGRKNSTEENRLWEESNPIALIEKMTNRFPIDEDRAQFRRIIRYMKKWRNNHFDNLGNGAPTGIALTALAYDYFAPCYRINQVTEKRDYDDFNALLSFVRNLKNCFAVSYDSSNQRMRHTILQKLFVAPYNNLFGKMTLKQQDEFYNKICEMCACLDKVVDTEKKAEACKLLCTIFGEAFPVKADRSFVGHSESACCIIR